MQVLPCSSSSMHYAGDSNSPNQGSEKAFVYDEGANNVKSEIVQGGNTTVDNAETSDDEQIGELDEGHPNNEPFHELDVSNNTRGSGVDTIDGDTVGRELLSGNQECESSHSEPEWLEQDQPMAVWVKVSF